MGNKLSNVGTKRDCINLVLSISFAVISYLILAKLTSLFYTPDISSILETARTFLIPGMINYCKPEPLEKILFIAGILLIPLFLFVYYSIFEKLLQNKEENLINNLWIFICLYTAITLPLFIFYVMNAPSLYVPPYSYFQLYILNSILDKNISLLAFVPFIFIPYVFLKINFSPINKPFKVIKMSLDIFCLLLIAYMAAICVFSIYMNDVHFEALFYSIVQLYKGVPLGVDGFTNTYGLYPYFLNIIFKIIGLSVFKCSVVFCILIALSYLLILFFLKNTVNSRILIFLGFVSVVYLPLLSKRLFSINLYSLHGQIPHAYQYLPLRYLFPCLLLFLCALYIKKKNDYNYILASIICALALLWNFDSGIIMTISWILLNFYSEFEQKNASTIFKNILWHTIKISSVMMITILFCLLCVFIFYGRILNLNVLFQTLNVFSKLSFYMLPMPLFHPWNILALTYTIGIGICIKAITEKDITPSTKNIFLVTIMGTGMLLYYQGRSHDYSFFGPSFYFFILLTLFLDRIISFLKSNRNLLLEFLSILIASILSLSVILMSINLKDEFSVLKNSIKDVQVASPMKTLVQMNSNFIKRHAEPSEKIIILSRDSGTYFSKIPNVSAFNPGLSDLFLKSDYDRLTRIIAGSDVKIFVDRTKEVNSVADILKTLIIIDTNGYMYLLKTNHQKNTTQNSPQ